MNASQGKGAVLVTGASTGIGKAIVFHLDELGYQVFASVRKDQDADMLRAETSGRTYPVILDVTAQDSIDAAKHAVQNRLGDQGLAGLVNNAGIGAGGVLEFFPLDELRALYEVNLFGVLAVTQAFLPMLRKARGRIINISSTASLFVIPTHGPYSSAKWALNGLSQALRLELLAHGVHVSVVICGNVDTPIWKKGRTYSRKIVQQYPPEAKVLYGSMGKQTGKFFSQTAKAGIPPETAARIIVKALTEKRPRNTYFVGRDAHLLNFVDKLFYGKLRDRLFMRFLGLKA